MNKDKALKLALEALEFNGNIWHMGCKKDEVITVIKEALAQDELCSSQELVHSVQSNGRHSPLLTHMMNKQTTPPKRQPLTLNEMSAIEEKVYMQTIHKGKPSFEYAHALIRATEAAHGIKENT